MVTFFSSFQFSGSVYGSGLFLLPFAPALVLMLTLPLPRVHSVVFFSVCRSVLSQRRCARIKDYGVYGSGDAPVGARLVDREGALCRSDVESAKAVKRFAHVVFKGNDGDGNEKEQFIPSTVRVSKRLIITKLYEELERMTSSGAVIGPRTYNVVAHTLQKLNAFEHIEKVLLRMRAASIKPETDFYVSLCAAAYRLRKVDAFLAHWSDFVRQYPINGRGVLAHLRIASHAVKMLMAQGGPVHQGHARAVRDVLRGLNLPSASRAARDTVARVWVEINIVVALTVQEAWEAVAALQTLSGHTLAAYFRVCERHCDVSGLKRGLARLHLVPVGDDKVLFTQVMKVYASVGDVPQCAAWMAKIERPDELTWVAMLQACYVACNWRHLRALYDTALLRYPMLSFWAHLIAIKCAIRTHDKQFCAHVLAEIRKDHNHGDAKLAARLQQDGVPAPEGFL